jgi:hypothetical protein
VRLRAVSDSNGDERSMSLHLVGLRKAREEVN